jgi:hypothetical protein
VRAGKDFRLIAAMNPFDAVGTARVSQAIADRMCRVVLGYQDESGERAITSAVSGLNGRHVELSVALTRATREHRDVRMGSSVRGAIDLALVLTGLAELRGEPAAGAELPGRETARDAAYAALSGRIRIADGVDRTPESVIDELLDELWPADPEPDPDPAAPDAEGKADRLPGPAPVRVGNTPDAPRAGPSWPPGTRGSTRSRPSSGSWTRRRSRPSWPGTRRRRPRCWPSWPWPPTPRCGRRPGGWPAGSSCGWAGSARRARAGPAGSARPAPWRVTSTWTARWSAGAPAGPGDPRRTTW